MNTHTSEPWTASEGLDGDCYVDIDSPEHQAFARVVVRMKDDEKPSPKLQANVALILAAPAMAKLLTRIRNAHAGSAWLSDQLMVEFIDSTLPKVPS